MSSKNTSFNNEYGQPIGEPVPDWQGAKRPEKMTLNGTFCRLVPLQVDKHADDLFTAFAQQTDNAAWTYLPYGPFDDKASYQVWLSEQQQSADPLFYAIIDEKTGKAVGVGSYLRISPEMGSIEVGHLAFSPLLQRTPLSTEAMFLMMQYAFEGLGYRRYEWKCDSLNAASVRAARRLGFQFEGIFRQALVYKGRNRDTAWFAVTDKEWAQLKQRFQHWLSAENFDETGIQRKRLEDC